MTDEVKRLRDRVDATTNIISALQGQVTALTERVHLTYGNVDTKLDAIHSSIKEDFGHVSDDFVEVKVSISEVNKQLTAHDRQIAQIRGALIVIAAGLPTITGLLLFALNKLI